MGDHRSRVLIVDDETGYAEDVAVLVSEELRCDVVGDPGSGMGAVRRFSYDLVFLDIELHHEIDGIGFLRMIKEFDPTLPVVMLTKSADLSTIIESIKSGAFYYVVKDTDPAIHDLVHIASLAIDDARMKRAVTQLEEDEGTALSAIVGKSPAMTRIRSEITRVAPLECSVMITGESGTGKELVARALHASSGRASHGRFVSVNCAALPEQLVDSALFGHEKGAFTGADRRRIGKFEHANRGTLLLDEIGDMPLLAQAKLLRVLQEKQFERVGGNQIVETDARVISATNHDIPAQIEAGDFREDLYYRIAEYAIHVPPLRDRPEDIAELASHMVGGLGRQIGRGDVGISQSALDALCERDWKRNNVRELRNALLAAIIRCDGDTIQPGHFAYDRYEFAEAPPCYEDAKREAVGQFKHRYMTHLLRLTKGNVAAAADIADIHRTAFHRHLTALGVNAKAFRE